MEPFEEEGKVFFAELLERVRALPGADRAAYAEFLPLGMSISTRGTSFEGQEKLPPDEWPEIDSSRVGPGYFATLGVDILRGDVLRLVMREGMTLVAVGLVLGIAVAYFGSQALKSLLYGISAGDPLTFAGVAVALVAVALVANLVPARRATRVDPIVALRYE